MSMDYLGVGFAVNHEICACLLSIGLLRIEELFDGKSRDDLERKGV